MKKITFILSLAFLALLLLIPDASAQTRTRETCETATCTCADHTPDYGIPGFCRSCTIKVNGVKHTMIVCSSVPTARKDQIACRRAEQRCNGQEITCITPQIPGGPVIAGVGHGDGVAASHDQPGPGGQDADMCYVSDDSKFEFNGMFYDKR